MNTFPSSKRTGAAAGRAAIYVRVSSDEQVDGYSLDAQERATQLYCKNQGWSVARVYRDEGKSARTDDLRKRPQFAQMLTDAENHLIDVVVVHKLDRFARNRKVAFDAFHRLGVAGVGFVSITENMDHSSPAGQLMLTMLVGLGQFYSDNLSAETKKGKAERKAQGLYNGLLPFGVRKNDEGQVEPDPATYPGLLLAFRTAAEGKSDREVADVLNDAGYRTTGNRGRNLFTKDTVRRVLQNRFYLGELPDSQRSWIPGAHAPLLDIDAFERVQAVRVANSTGAAKVRRSHRRYSLTGLAVCGHCSGRIHFNTAPNGRARYYCYQGGQATKCTQRSGMLELLEEQLSIYLGTFELPERLINEIVSLQQQVANKHDDSTQRRQQLQSRLLRLKDMYKWGDIRREEYLFERDNLQAEIASSCETTDYAEILGEAAAFLRDLPKAWRSATPDQRNALARIVFQEVEITDRRVTAVIPKPDFAPFFNLSLLGNETGLANMAAPERAAKVITGGSDGLRFIHSITTVSLTYLPTLLIDSVTYDCIDSFAPKRSGRKLTLDQQEDIRRLSSTSTLRALARSYGVSHETIRSVVKSTPANTVVDLG